MARNGHGSLEAHRQAWLDAHPGRNEFWLRRMAKEGFDVHHVDGDHRNNAPGNLVLMEHVDHMRLHGLAPMRRGLRDDVPGRQRRKPKNKVKCKHRGRSKKFIDVPRDGFEALLMSMGEKKIRTHRVKVV